MVQLAYLKGSVWLDMPTEVRTKFITIMEGFTSRLTARVMRTILEEQKTERRCLLPKQTGLFDS